MVQFRLNHYCNRKGAVGKPGEVVDVSDEVANLMQAQGGGRRIESAVADGPTETATAPRGRKRRAETATDKQAEAAETPED